MRPTRWTGPSNLIILLSFSGIVSINNRKNHYFSVAEKLKTQQGRDLQGRETELHIQVLAFSRGPMLLTKPGSIYLLKVNYRNTRTWSLKSLW